MNDQTVTGGGEPAVSPAVRASVQTPVKATTRRGVGLSWRLFALTVLFVTVSMTVLWPMFPTAEAPDVIGAKSLELNDANVTQSDHDQPPLPPTEVSTTPRDPSESLRTFLGRWEMNDFLFLLVIENLRPSSGLPPEQIAWFTVTPESWRAALVATVAQQTGLAAERVPFVLTRFLLSLTLIGLAAGLALWAAVRISDAEGQRHERLLEATFLTLAWFWLLLPTQNPWYLTWCLPFLPFARRRAWFALSGLAFVYYLRFWMTAQFPSSLLGTSYPGPQFFDFVVTWIEFAPWLAWLVIEVLGRQQRVADSLKFPTRPEKNR